jgi:hypothetical protein
MKQKVILLLVIGFAFIFPSLGIDGQQNDEPMVYANGRWGSKKVVVMTRNIYVGGNVDRVIAAAPEELVEALMETLDELQSTNFSERAVALAKEIRWGKPHLVGLQEISIIDIHLPAYGLVFSFDYEDIFMETLRSMGLDYYKAGSIQNTDATVPLGGDNYVRLIDFDVVLAREDVKTTRVHTGNYIARFPVDTIGVEVIRGYVAVDAEVGRKKYRFVNTHLEPFVDEVKMGQAMELMSILAAETLPVILVGDFNAEASDDPVYDFIVDSGYEYVDAWTRNQVHGNKDGFTSGFDPRLDDPNDTLEKRIDLIFIRSNVWNNGIQDIGPVIAFVVGDEPRDMTPSGLWPSDHAGVIARLKIPFFF